MESFVLNCEECSKFLKKIDKCCLDLREKKAINFFLINRRSQKNFFFRKKCNNTKAREDINANINLLKSPINICRFKVLLTVGT